MAAEDRGPLMHAAIGMRRALNQSDGQPHPRPAPKAAWEYRSYTGEAPSLFCE
jgi:hypothetical protein